MSRLKYDYKSKKRGERIEVTLSVSRCSVKTWREVLICIKFQHFYFSDISKGNWHRNEDHVFSSLIIQISPCVFLICGMVAQREAREELSIVLADFLKLWPVYIHRKQSDKAYNTARHITEEKQKGWDFTGPNLTLTLFSKLEPRTHQRAEYTIMQQAKHKTKLWMFGTNKQMQWNKVEWATQ